MAKNKENKQFTITLSERQLKFLAYACRVTDRLIIGQLDYSLQECCEAAFEKLHKNDEAGKIGSDMWYTMRYVVEKSMDILRKLCWGVERITYRHAHKAYRNISFECEAYNMQRDLLYLDDRKHYAWVKYLKK